MQPTAIPSQCLFKLPPVSSFSNYYLVYWLQVSSITAAAAHRHLILTKVASLFLQMTLN